MKESEGRAGAGPSCRSNLRGLAATSLAALVVLALLVVGSPNASALTSTTPSAVVPASIHPEIPGNPSGWTDWNQPVSWKNYSLPYFAGTRDFFSSTSGSVDNIFDSPVITQQNPTRTLTAYYVNSSGELLATNLVTGVSTNIHAWPTNWSNFNSPNMIQGYQGTNGTVSALYEMGNIPLSGNSHGYGGYIWVAWLSLYNDTYRVANTTIDIGATEANYGQGAWTGNGWVFVSNNALTTVWYFNVYSHQLISLATMAPLSNWNTPVYVPVVNTGVEDVNVPSNNTVEVRVFDVNFTTGTIAWRSLWSGAESFITGQDENNMPYLFAETAGGMDLWGIGSNSVGGGATYHDLEMRLYPNIASDAVLALTNTGSVGTTDANGGGYWDQSGYALNGYNGYGNSGTYQAPFIDPLNDSIIWATNSTWLNNFFDSQNFAFGAGPWVNAWSFFPSTVHWEDAVLYDPGHPTTSCGSTCDLLIYWLPSQTTEFANTPPAPGTPTFSSVTVNSATASWVQAPGGGILNDTDFLYTGGSCSGSATAISAGAATTYNFTGLIGGTTYSVSIAAWNVTGQGAFSNCAAFTTLAFGGGAAGPGSSSLFVLVGGSAVAVVVAGAIISLGTNSKRGRDAWKG
jgi:Fibronectin type III domain